MTPNDCIHVGDRVKIVPRGNSKTWTAEFWHDGQHRRVSLKTRNRKVAVQRAGKLDAELVDGKYRKAVTASSIQDAVDMYLSFLGTEGRARRTIVRYRGELQTLAAFCQGHRARNLSQITPSLFDKFRAERSRNGSPQTLYHEAMVCKQFLKWAVSRQLLAENPLRDYRVTKPPLVPRPAPTLEEVDRILNSCTPRLRPMLTMLALTGMRSGELRQLRPEDVDLDGGWIHIVSRAETPTKTRTSRKVPLHPRLKKLLEGSASPGRSWYFTAEPSRRYAEGNHWVSAKRLNESFVRTAAKLGLSTGRDNCGFTVHSLRHFFETHCVNAGIPQRVIDAWLGHRSDRSMAAVYYFLSDEESQKFMTRVPFGTGAPAANAGQTGEIQ